jgi:hypothetical protein
LQHQQWWYILNILFLLDR